MNAIRLAGGLLLGVAVAAGCDDRSTTASSTDRSILALDAAAGLTSVVTDPLGDAKLNHHNDAGPGSDKKVPDYLDVIGAEVAKQGRTFVFTESVGADIPSNPSEASGGLTDAQIWIFGLNTDPAFPQGDPLATGSTNPFEFFVDVEWDGTQFVGLLYDRRPLLSGGAMVVTPVPFAIEGTQVKLFVSASLLGDQSTFGWAAGTLTRHVLGTEGYQTLDLAPDAGLATWPQ
jgi:hypothetical protein